MNHYYVLVPGFILTSKIDTLLSSPFPPSVEAVFSMHITEQTLRLEAFRGSSSLAQETPGRFLMEDPPAL